MDAALIAAAVERPPYGSGGVNPRDPDARVTMKRKKAHFADKAHLAVDEGSGLARQTEMTSANVHDSCLADALIQGASIQKQLALTARNRRAKRRRPDFIESHDRRPTGREARYLLTTSSM
jgi:IS5 family transposase